MPILCDVLSLCGRLAYGFTMQPVQPEMPTIVIASYYQAEGCRQNSASLEFDSACREVPKARDKFAVPCKDGQLRCHVSYGLSSDGFEKPPQQLPPMTVIQPKPRKPKRKAGTAAGNGGQVFGPAAVAVDPPKPVAAQIAEQLARQGVMYGAQMGGAALGAPAGPAGAIIGGWAGCAGAKYGFLYQDYAQKERWDLHPEIADGNKLYAIKMCSPIGFLFRAQEAEQPHEKILALLGGLAWVADPSGQLVGQIAPALPQVFDNMRLIGPGSGSGSLFGGFKYQKPYHDGPWIADTHG